MIRFLLTTMLIGFLGITIYGQNYHQRLSIPSSQNVRDVKFDRQGNTYVVGHGDVEAYCLAETNVENRGTGYLYKVDSAGNILWRLNFGGNMCFAEGLNIGPEGHLYVVGYFRGTGDFSSTSSPSNGLASGNRDNAFILKATAQGEIIWAQSVGGQFDDTARDVTIDDEGNIYVTGSYNRTVNFGGHMLTSAEFSEDPFVWWY